MCKVGSDFLSIRSSLRARAYRMRAHADGATSFFFMQQQQTMTIGIVMTRTRKTRPPTAAPTMMPRTAEPSAAGGGVRGGVGVGGVGGGGVGDSTITYVYGWVVISVNVMPACGTSRSTTCRRRAGT